MHLLLGQIYLKKKDYLNAQELLETATRLSPQSSRQAFVLLIQIALRHKDADRARQYLDVMKQYFPLGLRNLEVCKRKFKLPAKP